MSLADKTNIKKQIGYYLGRALKKHKDRQNNWFCPQIILLLIINKKSWDLPRKENPSLKSDDRLQLKLYHS